METAQANSVLELAKRCFNSPSGKIKAFDVLRGEFIRRQVGHYAFVRIVIQWEPHDPDRDCIGIQGTVWYKSKADAALTKVI